MTTAYKYKHKQLPRTVAPSWQGMKMKEKSEEGEGAMEQRKQRDNGKETGEQKGQSRKELTTFSLHWGWSDDNGGWDDDTRQHVRLCRGRH